MVEKKAQDISKVSVPLVRGNMKIEDFKKWCAKHNFVGDLEKVHAGLQKELGVEPKETKPKAK